MKKIILPAMLMLVASSVAFAQEAKSTMFNGSTNLQVFYDFGKDRKHITTTMEGFYNDPWGNTFFFIDHDFNTKDANDKTYAPNGTYMEIARCFNFWSKSAIAPLSLQVEYNGGVYNGYTINNAWLFGIDYFLHSANFNNTLNLKVLYKYINYAGAEDAQGNKVKSQVPLQLTAVWGCQDLFGAKGLRFSGFVDFWWEEHSVCPWSDAKAASYRDWSKAETAHCVLLSEPQLWYSVGQFFGCPNLNVGGEVELAYNFGTLKGFQARPCLGVKWVF